MSPIVTVKNERDLPAIEFFRKHSAELSRFLIKEGVDKAALLNALKASKASAFAKDLSDELSNAAGTTIASQAHLSAQLKSIARERGALGNFKSAFV